MGARRPLGAVGNISGWSALVAVLRQDPIGGASHSTGNANFIYLSVKEVDAFARNEKRSRIGVALAGNARRVGGQSRTHSVNVDFEPGGVAGNGHAMTVPVGYVLGGMEILLVQDVRHNVESLFG